MERGTNLIVAADLGPIASQEFRRRIAHPALLRLFDYWRDLPRAHGALPSRAAIDPTQIPREALSSTMLLDVFERESRAATVRLRFRLVGTAVVQLREGMIPGDPTGRYMDEVEFREGAEESILFYATVATRCRPCFQTFAYSPRHPRFQGTYHRIAMPLSDDGSHVNMLLAGFSRDAGGKERG